MIHGHFAQTLFLCFLWRTIVNTVGICSRNDGSGGGRRYFYPREYPNDPQNEPDFSNSWYASDCLGVLYIPPRIAEWSYLVVHPHPSPSSSLQRCIGIRYQSAIGTFTTSQDNPNGYITLFTPSGGSLVVTASETGRYMNNPFIGTEAACAVSHFIQYQPSGTVYPIIA